MSPSADIIGGRIFAKKRLSFESKLNNKPQIASTAPRFAGRRS
jgi:hypothetical protein